MVIISFGILYLFKCQIDMKNGVKTTKRRSKIDPISYIIFSQPGHVMSQHEKHSC